MITALNAIGFFHYIVKMMATAAIITLTGPTEKVSEWVGLLGSSAQWLSG